MAGLLLLEWAGFSIGEDENDGVEVLSPMAACLKSAQKEPAGLAFHERVQELAGLRRRLDMDEEEDIDATKENNSPSKVNDERQSAQNSPLPTMPDSDYANRGKKKKGGKKKKRLDYYALIGLENERWMASEKQIQKAYRESALRHHPDKCGAAMADEKEKAAIDKRFKAIQEAYETLSDPAKRRAYDSTDEFDDSLPLSCANGEFYKVFGGAFSRQSRFSMKKNPPSLGDEDTPMEEVDSFYDFWFTFKSWREFPNEEEYDLESAEDRMHKRWMERQNSKMREKAKKDEERRLRDFIDAAFAKDPRIRARKKKEREEKALKKAAAEEAKRLKAEEEARRIQEEKEAAEREEREAKEAAAASKKQKEKDKKLVRKERARLRAIHAAIDRDSEDWPDWDTIEFLCTSFDIDMLRKICTTLENAASDHLRCSIIQDEYSLLKGQSEKEREERKRVAAEAAAKRKKAAEEAKAAAEAAEAAEWSPDELRLLDKAVMKYPRGTRNRWEMVAKAVRSKSVDEIIRMTKQRQACQGPTTGHQSDAFGQFQETLQQKSKRDTSIVSPASVAEEEEEEEGEKILYNGNNKKGGAADISMSSGNESISSGNGLRVEPGWTKAQEVALVKAVKQFGKDVEDRWGKIEAAVPDKTKIECQKHFLELKKNLRSKSSQAS